MFMPGVRAITQPEAACSVDRGEPRQLHGIEYIQHKATGIELFRLPWVSSPAEMQTAVRTDSSPDMIIVSRGSGRAAHGKMAGSRFTVAPSTAVRATFAPHGADSYIVYSPSSHTVGVSFPDKFLAQLVTEIAPTKYFDPILFQPDTRLVQLTQMIQAEIIAPGFASEMLIEGVCRAMAVGFLRYDHQTVRAEADRIWLPPWKLKRVLDFIDSNLDEDLRLQDLAVVAGLSLFHFVRVFKQATGVTPYHYVRDRRIERSRALLIDSKLEISQLALMCGFSSQSHFTAAFTKAVGVSPGRFRRESRV